MILGKSIDRAQIKKIPIRVWSLTDEINATVKALQTENIEKIQDEKYVLIKAFYEATPLAELNKRNKLTLVPGGKISTNPLDNTAAPGETDPFEAAMMAELEAKKASDAAAATVGVAASETTTPVAETPVSEIKATEDTIAPIKIEVPPKNYTIEDFLNLRKNGMRNYPEESCISNGNCIIYDVQFDQILFFTEKAFKPGQEVIIEFQIHKTFTVTAKIVSITNVGVGSRIISSQPVNYRINAILTHEHLGDRTLLRNFLSKVDPLINTHMA